MLSAKPALATVTYVRYSNYLPRSTEDTVAKLISIYAGRTLKNGTEECTTNNPSFVTGNTCNSCAKLGTTPLASDPATPCNETEIYPNLAFSVTIKSDAAEDYPVGVCRTLIVGRAVGATTTAGFAGANDVYTPSTVNQEITGVFTWKQLCQAATDDATCKKSFNTKFEFSFDRNCNQQELQAGGPQFQIRLRVVAVSPRMTLGCDGPQAFEGICNYTAVAGDKKVFIRNVQGVTGQGFKVPDLSTTTAVGDTEDPSGMTYSHLRIYTRAVNDNGLNMSYADPHTDLELEGAELKESRVKDLQNGVEYLLWGGMIDQAGNLTYLVDSGAFTANQRAIPQEVFGLLDEKGCFVATAAYGSPQAQEIHILREFRDVYLARTEFGRGLIRFYYAHSPRWAAVIRDNEVLRGVVQAFLGPVIGMADLSLRYGVWVCYVSIVTLLSLIFVAASSVSWVSRRRRRTMGGA